MTVPCGRYLSSEIEYVLQRISQNVPPAARIEYAEGAIPWLTQWAVNKKWQRILLVATLLFYGGTLYELLKEPLPPKLQFTDPERPFCIANCPRKQGIERTIGVVYRKGVGQLAKAAHKFHCG